MMRAAMSEWTKLMRLGQILGSWGTMVGFGLLLSILLLSNAKDVEQTEQAAQGPPSIPLALLEQADGASFAFRSAGQLLGIIALVIAAGNMATEYTSGTLKVLLVRQPRRGVLFAGKLSALWAFVLAGVTMTLAASLLASVAVASARGIDMGAWWSGDGLRALGEAYVNVAASAFVWALMGITLAVLFRSGFPAIGVGIAYPLVVEGLLALVLPDVVKWMPGSVLGRMAAGDVSEALGSTQTTIGYTAAVLLAFVYALVFAGSSIALLVRRDVT
jgi:ABC-2 type transport system permease protein